MSFESPTLETQGEGEHIDTQEAFAKMLEISDIKTHIDKISENQDPEIQERLKNANLQDEVLQFISDAANGKLAEHSSEYAADKYDTDGEVGLDKFEFTKFSESLTSAIEQIIILDGIGAFNKIQEDSSYSGWYSPDKKIAEYADVQELFLGDDESSTFIEDALNSLGVSNEELHEMSEKPFDIASSESWGEMAILLMKELGSGVEDILRFMGNIPAGTILLPRYLIYRSTINSDDIVQATEGEIKIKELVEDNPSLALLDLLGEKGVDMIQQLGKMIVSGKQGDIAMMLVTIAGLIAGGAGAVKLGARVTNMTRVERVAGKIQRGAERVDDIVGSAGLRHFTGDFNPANDNRTIQTGKIDRIQIPEEALMTGTYGASPQRFNPELIMRNASLNVLQRTKAAENLLGSLSPTQQKALIDAHNYGAGGEGFYTGKELVAKRRILIEAGYTKQEAMLLMDKGLAGDPRRVDTRGEVTPAKFDVGPQGITYKFNKTELEANGNYIEHLNGFITGKYTNPDDFKTFLKMTESGRGKSKIDGGSSVEFSPSKLQDFSKFLQENFGFTDTEVDVIINKTFTNVNKKSFKTFDGPELAKLGNEEFYFKGAGESKLLEMINEKITPKPVEVTEVAQKGIKLKEIPAAENMILKNPLTNWEAFIKMFQDDIFIGKVQIPVGEIGEMQTLCLHLGITPQIIDGTIRWKFIKDAITQLQELEPNKLLRIAFERKVSESYKAQLDISNIDGIPTSPATLGVLENLLKVATEITFPDNVSYVQLPSGREILALIRKLDASLNPGIALDQLPSIPIGDGGHLKKGADLKGLKDRIAALKSMS